MTEVRSVVGYHGQAKPLDRSTAQMRSQRSAHPTQFLVPNHSTKAACYVCASERLKQLKKETSAARSGARKQKPWYQELRWDVVFLKSVAFVDVKGASVQ